jgi:hypothetical protein
MDGIYCSHGRDKNCTQIVDSESKWNKPLGGFNNRIILKCILRKQNSVHWRYLLHILMDMWLIQKKKKQGVKFVNCLSVSPLRTVSHIEECVKSEPPYFTKIK